MSKIDIIDVTLRDGGHAVDFDWSLDFAREYYDVVSQIPSVKFVELGYWSQTAKSENMFYNLNFDKVQQVTRKASRKNVSIMVDYHYCSHILSDYPTSDQNEIGMIRVCARKGDLKKALIFSEKLRKETGLLVSLNIFNVTNYNHNEMISVLKKVSEFYLDYVYFADTHGSLDLVYSGERFKEYVRILNQHSVEVGMHLHDHSGQAIKNFSTLKTIGFSSTDASAYGIGKGEGNLRLEHILGAEHLPNVLRVIDKYKGLLEPHRNLYCLLTAKYSLTDYYALVAEKEKLSFKDFEYFCQNVSGEDKDVYDYRLFYRYVDIFKSIGKLRD